MIKQNIFEFSSESRFHENELMNKENKSAGKSPVYFLVYRDKVRHPSTAKFYKQVWKKVTCAPTIHYFATNLPLVDMLARTWQEIEYRLDIVRATDGVHVKVY